MVRLTARARLASLQTALVLAAGAALTGLTYLLMRRRVIFTHLDPVGTPSPDKPPQDGLYALADRVQADTLSALLPQAALALIVVTGLSAVLSWLVAGRVLRPIRVISATARRLSAENLTERVPVTTRTAAASTSRSISLVEGLEPALHQLVHIHQHGGRHPAISGAYGSASRPPHPTDHKSCS